MEHVDKGLLRDAIHTHFVTLIGKWTKWVWMASLSQWEMNLVRYIEGSYYQGFALSSIYCNNRNRITSSIHAQARHQENGKTAVHI